MNSKNVLYNPENYNTAFDELITFPYFDKYSTLLHQYLIHINENIYVQDEEYKYFIIERGIDTLMHIFTTLLMYTRNIDITYHHTEKAYCYYVEFISQISEESHSFLKLNSKDAALFVYKKTVFDINQDYRKNFEQNEDEKEMLSNLHSNIKSYNEFSKYVLRNKLVLEGHSEELEKINDFEQNIFFIIKYGQTVYDYIYDSTQDETTIKQLFEIISLASFYLYKYNIQNTKIVAIHQTLVKKYIKSPFAIDIIYKKVVHKDIETMLDHSPIKIVNWLTNDDI